MKKQRRNLIKLFSMGALFPGQVAYALNSIVASNNLKPNSDLSKAMAPDLQKKNIEKQLNNYNYRISRYKIIKVLPMHFKACGLFQLCKFS